MCLCFTNIFIHLNYAHIKHTVKTSSCPLQIQIPLIVLSLSSPNIQALANAPFLNESNRWYIPLIKLQDMKTYINPKTHMLMTNTILFNFSNISQTNILSHTFVNSLLYLYSPSQIL